MPVVRYVANDEDGSFSCKACHEPTSQRFSNTYQLLLYGAISRLNCQASPVHPISIQMFPLVAIVGAVGTFLGWQRAQSVSLAVVRSSKLPHVVLDWCAHLICSLASRVCLWAPK